MESGQAKNIRPLILTFLYLFLSGDLLEYFIYI